jgi:hypothetical protein
MLQPVYPQLRKYPCATAVTLGAMSRHSHAPPIPPQPTQDPLELCNQKAFDLPEAAARSDNAQRFGFKVNEKSQELYSKTWALKDDGFKRCTVGADHPLQNWPIVSACGQSTNSRDLAAFVGEFVGLCEGYK